jgi:AAHS family benzoate transporter-like MFS transporter
MTRTPMTSGVPIGGSIAALSGIVIIPARGWPGMFLIAVLPLIFLVPLGIKYLPDVRTVAAPGQGTGIRADLRAVIAH